MESLVHLDLAPPKTWEQFEEFCADTFAALWSDPGLVRHGRSGQRQKGVDIISRPGGRWTGLQCKKKAVWPIKTLTKAEIDSEVKEALTFTPKPEDFWILTTAPDDVHLQAHVNQLNEKHEAAKEFTVHLLGWREILTHATLYPRVVAKHFGIQVAQEESHCSRSGARFTAGWASTTKSSTPDVRNSSMSSTAPRTAEYSSVNESLTRWSSSS